MKSKLTLYLAAAASLFAGAALLTVLVQPSYAHHAFAAEFDLNKPFDVTGVVSKVDWRNPHVYVYLDAPGEGGKTVTYAMECNSVNTLAHKGWTRDALKAGDKVTISAYGSKDPRPLANGNFHANARSIKFVDGRTISAGSSAGEAPKK